MFSWLNDSVFIDYRWLSQLDWFSRLSRNGKSEKSNWVELTNDNLFIAMLFYLWRKTLLISLTTARIPLDFSDNFYIALLRFHITPLRWERKLSVSKIKGKFCKIAIIQNTSIKKQQKNKTKTNLHVYFDIC